MQFRHTHAQRQSTQQPTSKIESDTGRDDYRAGVWWLEAPTNASASAREKIDGVSLKPREACPVHFELPRKSHSCMATLVEWTLVLATRRTGPLTCSSPFEPLKASLCPRWTAVDHQGGTKPGFLGASAAAHKPRPGISRYRTVLPLLVWSPWGCLRRPWLPFVQMDHRLPSSWLLRFPANIG